MSKRGKVKERRVQERSSLHGPFCVRRPSGFICLTEEVEVVDTEDMARQADEWHRHNRWRRYRCLKPTRARRAGR